ncbi:MAG: CBS domain-containing protein [Gemmatimonadota bacterium]|nr:MAG: CBS domain-containing protein [Gemmatimonadota bacterium]
MAKPTALSRLLLPDRVIVGLKASTYSDAVAQLLDRLDAAGLIIDRTALDEQVEAEVARPEQPTIGARAILAHYRSDAAKELAVAVGTSTKPFRFAPPSARKAVFLILIIAPRWAAKTYLKTLAALSTTLANPAVADALAGAESVEEFLTVIAGADLVVHPELMVRDLMSRDFQTVSPDTPLSEALRVMVRHRRRGVSVVSDNGEVLGLVTQQEILQHFLPQVLGAAPLPDGGQAPVEDIDVRDVMQRTVMCLSEDQLISDVLGSMLSESVAQFPVVSGGKQVGFLSRTDILVKLLEHSV